MNITIITPVFPFPLNSGGAQAQFNMIDKLRAENNITLIYIQKNIHDYKNELALKEIWPNVNFVSYKFCSQLTSWTFLYNKAVRAFKLLFLKKNEHFKVERALKPYGIFYTKRLINFVNKALINSRPDVVQVEFYPCLHIINFLHTKAKKIFVHHEIRFVRNERLLKNINLSREEYDLFEKIKNVEIADLNKYNTIVTLTATDKEVLSALNIQSEIVASPAAINTTIHPISVWKGKLLLLGGYSHKPNVEGTDWLMEEVISKWNGKAEIHMIGSGWPLQKIDYYRKITNRNITYHGFVEDLYTIAQGSVMLIPILTGSGMRMKILEAAAMGLPIVSTTVGIEGLNFKNNESCIVADKPECWLKALDEICHNEDLRRRLSDKAQSIYSKYYSLDACVTTRKNIYKFKQK